MGTSSVIIQDILEETMGVTKIRPSRSGFANGKRLREVPNQGQRMKKFYLLNTNAETVGIASQKWPQSDQ